MRRGVMGKRSIDLQQRWDVLYVEGIQETRAALVGGAAAKLHLHVDGVDDGQRRLLLAAQPTREHLQGGKPSNL